MIGGYCIAKLPDGDVMTEVMSAEDIYKVRDTSKAWKKSGGPWKDWPDEMAKKTVMKRAAKSWPQTPNRQRLDTAVDALHEAEGTAYTIDEHIEYMRLIQAGDAVGLYLFERGKPEQVRIALYNSFDKGEKVENKKRVSALVANGYQKITEWGDMLCACIDADDDYGAREILDDIPQAAVEWIISSLNNERLSKLNQMKEAV